MNKKTFRYFYILLIFLIIININIISAEEINQDTNVISEHVLNDGTGIDQVSDDGGSDTNNLENDNTDGNDESDTSTADNPQNNENNNVVSANVSETPYKKSILRINL